MNEVIELTVDYTLSRYPDVSELVPYEEYDQEIAQEKVGRAKKIFELLNERYKQLSVKIEEADETEEDSNKGDNDSE